jgi:hypothetical protein
MHSFVFLEIFQAIRKNKLLREPVPSDKPIPSIILYIRNTNSKITANDFGTTTAFLRDHPPPAVNSTTPAKSSLSARE